MNISDEERNYISKIYRHGLNHLTEDTIPNKLICIHNIHWCLETLLRKATFGWQGIDYNAGFKDIFQKFSYTYAGQISPNLQKAIEKFNEMRNDMEHREMPPDMTFLRMILPKVYEFVKWLIKTVFNSSLNIYTIPAVDLNSIYQDFFEWKEKMLGGNLVSKLRDETGHARERNAITLDDYIFICLIPSSYSPELVDLSADNINEAISTEFQNGVTFTGPNPEHHSKIEHYFRDFRILSYSQIVASPLYVNERNDQNGSEIKLFSDGRMYVCLNYRPLCQVKDIPEFSIIKGDDPRKEFYTFNLDSLFIEGTRILTEKAQKKYGISLDYFCYRNLEHLLKIVCFPFHPDCKIKMVKMPTTHFSVLFLFPMMRITGFRQKRILHQNTPFPNPFREFIGEDEELTFQVSFNYEEIPEIPLKLKNFCYGFFKNPEDTYYG